MPYQIPGVKYKPGECVWCHEPAPSNARECSRCWELRVRIEGNLKLAEEMIEVLKANKELYKGDPNDD